MSIWDRVRMGGIITTCERCGEEYVRGGRIGLQDFTAAADCGCALPAPPLVPAEAREVAITTPPPRAWDPCVMCGLRQPCAGPLVGVNRFERSHQYCAECWAVLQPLPRSSADDDEHDEVYLGLYSGRIAL